MATQWLSGWENDRIASTCGQGLPKLDRASERHVVTFYIKSLFSWWYKKRDNDIVLTLLCLEFDFFKCNCGV